MVAFGAPAVGLPAMAFVAGVNVATVPPLMEMPTALSKIATFSKRTVALAPLVATPLPPPLTMDVLTMLISTGPPRESLR
jgi:hypothetical protein